MYTKGLWEVSNQLYNNVLSKKENGRGFRTVATAYGSCRDETEANAHLIASAPALLEACKKTVDYLNYPPENMVDALHVGIEIRNIVKATIAAAEGRD